MMDIMMMKRVRTKEMDIKGIYKFRMLFEKDNKRYLYKLLLLLLDDYDEIDEIIQYDEFLTEEKDREIEEIQRDINQVKKRIRRLFKKYYKKDVMLLTRRRAEELLEFLKIKEGNSITD